MSDDIITVTPRAARGEIASPCNAICWEIRHVSSRASHGAFYGRILRSPTDAGYEAANLALQADVPLLLDPDGLALHVAPGHSVHDTPVGLENFIKGLNEKILERAK